MKTFHMTQRSMIVCDLDLFPENSCYGLSLWHMQTHFVIYPDSVDFSKQQSCKEDTVLFTFLLFLHVCCIQKKNPIRTQWRLICFKSSLNFSLMLHVEGRCSLMIYFQSQKNPQP